MVRRVLLAALAVCVVVLAWTAVAAAVARAHLGEAEDVLDQARRTGDAEQAAALLALASDDLGAASGWLHHAGPSIAGVVPLLGRHVHAVRTSTDAALAVVEGTRGVLAAVDGPGPLVADSAVDLARLRAAADALRAAEDRAREPVDALVDHPTSRLLGVVESPLRRAQAELGDVPARFGRAADAADAMSSVLGGDGPTSLLVVLQNNAELRATGGLVSVFAPARAVDGRLEVGRFADVEDVAAAPEQAETVPAPEDFRRLWGAYLADTTLWKNTNMAADVPTSSAVLAEVAAATLPERPQAVLWLDVRSIGALIGATRPATLPDGTELDEHNAVDVLLRDAYANAPDDDPGQQERRRVLRSAADAVLAGLLGGEDVSVPELAEALGGAAAGRHLAVWSADPEVQQRLVDAGIAGAVDAAGGDLSSFTVHNLGGGDPDGNKLDYYARRSVAVHAEVGEREARVEQVVVLRNEAPVDGLPAYVAGTGTPGTTHNLVSFAVPSGARDVTLTRGEAVLDTEPRPSGDHTLVLDVVSLPPGTAATWELRYRVPVVDGQYRLTVVPQPLAVDAELEVRLTAADGRQVRGRTPGLDEDGAARTRTGPFDRVMTWEVDAERLPWTGRARDALVRFWNEPVRLP